MKQAEPSANVTIRPLGLPGDLGWIVMAHGELYAREFGWDTTFETLVARIVADFAAARDAAGFAAASDAVGSAAAQNAADSAAGADVPPAGWIAELAGRRVGCVLCVPGDEPGVAKLRLLLVTHEARGRQVGSRLVRTAIDAATAAGYARMKLWTNDPLLAARAIYLNHGFALTAEEPHHSFGVDLVGQTYERALS